MSEFLEEYDEEQRRKSRRDRSTSLIASLPESIPEPFPDDALKIEPIVPTMRLETAIKLDSDSLKRNSNFFQCPTSDEEDACPVKENGTGPKRAVLAAGAPLSHFYHLNAFYRILFNSTLLYPA